MEDKQNIDLTIGIFARVSVAVVEHLGALEQLPKSIQKFIMWRKHNKLPPSQYRTFNFIYDDPATTPPEKYRFDLAVDINDQSLDSFKQLDGITVKGKVIPKARYVKVRHQGSDAALGDIIHYLYGNWLVENNEQPLDFPLFFERVSFFPDVSETDMITDVYLLLK